MTNVEVLWAKKNENSGIFKWLPLSVHLKDTESVIGWLFDHWLSSSQRVYLSSQINSDNEEDVRNVLRFLGAVHDIGKATPAFQIQKGYANSEDLDKTLLERLERAGFTGISSLTLTAPRATHHTLAGEFILKKYGVEDDIGSIVGAHHGKPIDSILDCYDQKAYPANYYQAENPKSEIYKKWEEVQRSVLELALKQSGFSEVSSLPEISQPGQVLMSGLLIMADWIASNEEYFPLYLIDQNVTKDPEQLMERFREGIQVWYRDMPLEIYNTPSCVQLYQQRFGFSPKVVQEKIFYTFEQIRNPGIAIIEAPMGMGKTEAALAAAEVAAAKTGSSGLFFGLPTQATSNGMFGRVKQWLDSVTKAYETSQSLRLCHGKAALNEEMSSLQQASRDINIDDLDNGSVFVNEWFSGRKKTALDDFVVGTVDGFLLTALKQKHLALRHLGFSKKVVIIDEVHAYDTYMQQYLEEAIQWMGAYSAPVILVSATLPQEKRESLIRAYLKGKGVRDRNMSFPEAGNSYPLISYTDGSEIKTQVDFSSDANKCIFVRKLDEDCLMDTIDDLLENGGVLGIIVNTVRRAQELGRRCKELFGADRVDILHSAYIATDRIEKESELMNMIGKNSKRPEKKIIIGTQVMEQSLDIDFDVLITDLCPVDLLLQRMGRLHRHEIQRPGKLAKPVVYVLGTNKDLDFNRGTERIYGKYFLIRTQYFLPDEIQIPADIPKLIHKVYGDEELNLSDEGSKKYSDSFNKMKIERANKADKAKTYRIESPDNGIYPEESNLIGWLKEADHSESDEMAAAQVRDTSETVEVIALKKYGQGYGLFKDGKDISDRIDAPGVAKEAAKQTIRLPNFAVSRMGVTKTIEYLEEYNRKNLKEWQEVPWLKGALGIIFDENNCFLMNDMCLKYDSEYGLREEK